MVAVPLDPPPHAPRIWAIEGLRAWLAWTVVLSHVIQVCGIDRVVHGFWITQFAASEAVRVFIIISGFVITGVVLARRESWGRFITRRIFRIFPIYLLFLPLGAITMYLAQDAVAFMPWAADPRFTWDDSVAATITSVEQRPLSHVAPHVLLLQGVIPDSVLPKSSQSFLGPAWSLSLEWQFYLLAPLLIWMLRRRLWSAAAVLLVATLAILFRLEVFGHFEQPSLIFGLGHLFVIGIASRLTFDQLKNLQFHGLAVAVACVAIAFLFQSVFAIALWLAFLALLADQARAPRGRALVHAALWPFQSRIATAFGARSYAVYLAHWPVVQAAAYFVLSFGALSQWHAFAALGAATLIGTLILAELLHLFIERPMIRLGAAVAEGRAAWPRRRAYADCA
ncbi:acyltransferase family protein [Terricaulis sp.]|uniref:acyltransferase family protein n=1 Tax=Terricaulis sp. TaxID=2768686 RepID=UPI0037849D0C